MSHWVQPEAEAELEEAALYLAEHAGPAIAEAFLLEYERVLELLVRESAARPSQRLRHAALPPRSLSFHRVLRGTRDARSADLRGGATSTRCGLLAVSGVVGVALLIPRKVTATTAYFPPRAARALPSARSRSKRRARPAVDESKPRTRGCPLRRIKMSLPRSDSEGIAGIVAAALTTVWFRANPALNRVAATPRWATAR